MPPSAPAQFRFTVAGVGRINLPPVKIRYLSTHGTQPASDTTGAASAEDAIILSRRRPERDSWTGVVARARVIRITVAKVGLRSSDNV